MFICFVKATTLRLFGTVVLCLAALISAGAISASLSASPVLADGISFENIKTEEDRRAFLSACGHTPTEEAEVSAEVSLPKALDAVLLGYNEIQKQQGFDLSRYTGKTVTRYTYRLANEGNTPVYANIIVYRHKIIAADITAPGADGFVKPLCVATEE